MKAIISVRCMGVGTTVYTTPTYLILNHIRPGNPTQPNRIERSLLPAVVVTTFGRIPMSAAIGMRDAYRTEMFVIYAVAEFTKDSVGYTGSDELAFLEIVHASFGELQERLRTVLADYSIDVVDSTHGLSTGSHTLGKGGEYYDYVDAWKVFAVGYLEVNVGVERS